MKILVNNSNNIKDSEVNEVVKRVKILLLNSQNEILLGHSRENYQFPGGHVDVSEKLLNALNREIKEEVGINLNIQNLEPFACMYNYYKDYPKKGLNRKNEIYYYLFYTDLKPDLANTNYTKEEIKGNFSLKYVPFDQLIDFLNQNIETYGDEYGIAHEMNYMLKECDLDIKKLLK